MMNSRTRTLALGMIALAGLACSSTPAGPEAPTATTPAQEPVAVSPDQHSGSLSRAPAILDIRGPEQIQPNSTLELELVITRRVPLNAPISLSVKLPPGATLLSGESTVTLQEPGTSTLSRKITLQLQGIPEDDLVVEMDSQARGAGFHATKAWTFGRPAKMLATPPPGPRPLVIRGRNLGRPILMPTPQ